MEARYNTPDRRGETRRGRNARFGLDSPAQPDPKAGLHLLSWIRDAGRDRRWTDGYPSALSPSDWMAWAKLTGEIVRQEEFQILRDMDGAYINALCKELNEQREREK